MKRVAAAVLVGAATVLALASPAAAHGGSTTGRSNHRAELLGLSPAVDGVHVRLIDDGTRIELDAGSHEVVVLGYEGEPYLRIDGDGVSRNRRSPSTYLNRSLNGDTPPPDADAKAEPVWEHVDDGTTARWHDHALHVPPGQASGARAESRWSRPLLIDGEAVGLRGRIVTLPSPSPVPWLALAAVAGVVVVVAGLVSWPVAMVTALVVLVAAEAARLFGLVLGAPAWLVSRAQSALDVATMSVIGTGMAVAAVVLVVRRRRLEAAAAAAVAGGLLAVTGGVLEIGDLTSAIIGSALPDGIARGSVALVLGIGAGVALSALLELRRGSSRPASRRRRSGTAPSQAGDTRTASSSTPPSG